MITSYDKENNRTLCLAIAGYMLCAIRALQCCRFHAWGKRGIFGSGILHFLRRVDGESNLLTKLPVCFGGQPGSLVSLAEQKNGNTVSDCCTLDSNHFSLAIANKKTPAHKSTRRGFPLTLRFKAIDALDVSTAFSFCAPFKEAA